MDASHRNLQGAVLVASLAFMTALHGCSERTGLVKTPLQDLVKTNFLGLGISMDIPQQPKRMWGRYQIHADEGVSSQDKGLVVLALHPIGGGGLAEPGHALEFYLVRFSEKQFQAFLNGKHSLCGAIPFSSSPLSFQENVAARTGMKHPPDGNEYLCFRKDTKLPNGDVVAAGASLLNNEGAIPNKESDIKAIETMLNSIQPLEEK